MAIKLALSIYPIMRRNSKIGVWVHFADGVEMVVIVCMAANDDDDAATTTAAVAAAVVTASSLDRRVLFCFLLFLRFHVFVAAVALLFASGDADCSRLFVFSCFFSSLSRCGGIVFSFSRLEY